MKQELDNIKRPEGVTDLLPGTAESKRQVENTLLSTFFSWGYQEVSTPTLELENLFENGLQAGLKQKLYRFPDNRGSGLVLRPDWTLPLARVVVTYMLDQPLPLRLAYSGSVFRMISSLRGERREFFQTGVELVGEESTAGDAEVVGLCLEALHQAGIPRVKVCLGEAGFLEAALESLKLPPEGKSELRQSINRRDFVYLKKRLAEINEPGRDLLFHLPKLRGDKKVIDRAWQIASDDAVRGALERLAKVVDHLQLLGYEDQLIIDLSLARGLGYYSGAVFEIYTPELRVPLGGGGRYDNLLAGFGRQLPATGFAVSVDSILKLWEKKGHKHCRVDAFVCCASGQERRGISEAARLRSQGKRVVFDLHPRSLEQARTEAARQGVKRLVYVCGHEITSEDLK